jgi:hypothetical protein
MTTANDRPRRAFVPTMNGGVIRLEPRDVPAVAGPLWLHWWDWPQGSILLTDDRGKAYSPRNGDELTAALTTMQKQGRRIGILAIKNHGDNDVIGLSNTDKHDTLAIIQGHLQINLKNVDKLFPSVCGPNSRIYLTGCNTGPMAPELSKLCKGTFWGSPLPTLGLPATPLSIGVYVPYSGGKRLPSDPGPVGTLHK